MKYFLLENLYVAVIYWIIEVYVNQTRCQSIVYF
jgi:hypothetical protein